MPDYRVIFSGMRSLQHLLLESTAHLSQPFNPTRTSWLKYLVPPRAQRVQHLLLRLHHHNNRRSQQWMTSSVSLGHLLKPLPQLLLSPLLSLPPRLHLLLPLQRQRHLILYHQRPSRNLQRTQRMRRMDLKLRSRHRHRLHVQALL